MFDCAGKKVLITGSTRGLGRELAAKLHAQGADVFLVARTFSELQLVREGLLGDGSNADVKIVACDLADSTAPMHIASEVERSWGYVDALVNNAATQGPIGFFWENDWEQWTHAVNVDFLAPVALCHALIPLMLPRRKGNIINLSGGGATSARPRFSAYAAAKTSLVRFTETLAKELLPFGIRANAVAPGVMNTEMLQQILSAGPEQVGAEYDALMKRGEGTDSRAKAAALIAFLISDESVGITGRLLSAVWDPLDKIMAHAAELDGSDIYTLRRILPEDRAAAW